MRIQEWSYKNVPYIGMHKETYGPRPKGPAWVSVLVYVLGYGIWIAVLLWLASMY